MIFNLVQGWNSVFKSIRLVLFWVRNLGFVWLVTFFVEGILVQGVVLPKLNGIPMGKEMIGKKKF